MSNFGAESTSFDINAILMQSHDLNCVLVFCTQVQMMSVELLRVYIHSE